MCGAIVEGILQPTAAQDPGFLGQIADSTTVGPKQKCRHLHSPWANSKIVTSFSKSSGPRFDRLDGSRMIKEKVLEG